MENELSKVYVKINRNGYIISVEGGYTLDNIDTMDNWTYIDGGYGDRFSLCQTNYFAEQIVTDNGAYRYKLVNGQPVKCTDEEIAAQEAARQKPEESMTQEELLGIITDHEYRLCLAELGIEPN